jgi:uncharacterized protein with FMN-binding domain
MKRITFWFLSTLSVVVLLFGYDGSTSATTTATPPPVVSGGTSGSTSSSSGSSSSSSGSSGSSGSAGSSGSSTGSTKATTVTGAVASTEWGPVQVQLTVKAGKITRVSVVQYPNGNGRDQEINSYALPILTQETTSAQSASIDMVSGATVTSNGYIQSLQSAIDQANL